VGEGLHERSTPITDRHRIAREILLIFIPYSGIFLVDHAWVNSIYLFFVFITMGKKSARSMMRPGFCSG
jgi:hypothetical protein